MGLDGISPNQLRLTPEYNSGELNNPLNFPSSAGSKAINGLTSGKKVDPDEDKEHESSDSNFKDKKKDEEEIPQEDEPTVKYDLTQADKYSIKIDEKTDTLLIIETKTGNVIQSLDSKTLSDFVYRLADAKGSIINRTY